MKRNGCVFAVLLGILFWAVVLIVVVVAFRAFVVDQVSVVPIASASQPYVWQPVADDTLRPLPAVAGESTPSSQPTVAPSQDAPKPVPALPPDPAGIGNRLMAGWASTFDAGPGYYGAVHSYAWGEARYFVRVCAVVNKARCVVVRIVSFCACGRRHGIPTVIDLSPAAMRSLAGERWRQLGIIRVIVIGVRS